MGDKDNTSATFVLYSDWEDIITDLTDEEVGQLFKAVFAYVNHGTVENFNGRTGLGVAYKTIRKQIDVNRKKYEQVVEKRKKAALKRWEKQNADMQVHNVQMQNDAKNANAFFAMHNDNVNVNGNDNDNGNVNVNVNGNDNDNDNVSASNVISMLTESERADLVRLSSVSSVETYISKILDWQSKNGKKCKDVYSTIRKWIEQDKSKAQYSEDTGKSYDMDEYEKFAMNYKFPEFPD